MMTDGGGEERTAASMLGFSTCPCASHLLNLVVRDLLPSSFSGAHPRVGLGLSLSEKEEWEKIYSLRVKTHDLICQLRRASMRALTHFSIPSENTTRWFGMCNGCKALLDHESEIRELDGLESSLTDDEWSVLKGISSLLMPMECLNKHTQKRTGSLRDIIVKVDKAETSLKSVPTSTSLGAFAKRLLIRSFWERMWYVRQSPFAQMAEWMNASQKDRSNSQTHENCGRLLTAITPPDERERTLQDMNDWTGHIQFKHIIDPVLFWGNMKGSFAHLGKVLCGLPCSSAFLEGCFSVCTRVARAGVSSCDALIRARTIVACNKGVLDKHE